MDSGTETMCIVTGCSAVGKTDYAIDFAKKNNAEILSCDSILVYRHMNIGTAKPTAADMRSVRHHCIDLVDPCERFDVAMFIAAAKNAIREIEKSGKNVVVVGGPGFYLKAFFGPVIDGVKIGKDVNDFVNAKYETSGLDGVLSMLTSANGGVFPHIDVKNPRRIVSALKRCLASGKTLDAMRDDFEAAASPFAAYSKHTILLERPAENLAERVRKRAEKMLRDGLVEEVKFLLANYENLSAGAGNVIGYRETIRWLQNPTAEMDLIDAISRSTMKLIKKQGTWLKKHIPVDEIILLRNEF
ncbi:MAG: tRNA (adenosine(37)-N6)-dimethylallyltransferase MiaA [Puniceicoccales bacterium]|nr:tRNA (adenosine(37)-N6)-dimethylallyltransferase MiaA [Puniceicoccales bacterium]